jgi:hypothetical protein
MILWRELMLKGEEGRVRAISRGYYEAVNL